MSLGTAAGDYEDLPALRADLGRFATGFYIPADAPQGRDVGPSEPTSRIMANRVHDWFEHHRNWAVAFDGLPSNIFSIIRGVS